MKRLCITLLLISASAQARDLGFRYSGGKCVDAKGKAGMNPGYLGQCGDLRQVTMARFNFDQTDLSGASFQDADLQDSSFQGATLDGVVFKNANLAGANFDAATGARLDFSQAQLVNAHLAGSNFTLMNLSGVDLSQASLSYMNFAAANLSGAKLIGATLDHCDFTGTDLSSAALNGADLQSAVLTNANLSQADLTGATLVKANLKGVAATTTKLRRAALHYADLTQAHFENSDFNMAALDHTHLDGAKFMAADLRNANLSSATYAGADFSKALYSRRTVLPFSADDAAKLGMITGKAGSLLVISDSDRVELEEFKTALEADGMEVELSPQMHEQFDGSIDLSNYTTILHLEGVDYENDMPLKGQAAILQFVQAGGSYIDTQWSGYALQEEGYGQTMQDLILMAFETTTGGERTYAVTPGQELNPVLGDVTSFQVTTDQTASPIRKFDNNPVQVLMRDQDQYPVFVSRDVGAGHAFNFAFAPNDNNQPLSSPGIRKVIENILNL